MYHLNIYLPGTIYLGLIKRLNLWLDLSKNYITKLTGDTNDWQRFRNVKKSTNHLLKRSLQRHVNSKLSDAFENNYTKPFWLYIKFLRNVNNGVAPIKEEGKLHSDPTQKANLLNKQFQSVFVKEDHKIHVPKFRDTTAPILGDLKITTKGVEKQLSTLNIKKASWPDQIPNIFLKQTAVIENY